MGSGRGTPPESAEVRPAAVGKRPAPSAPPAPALRTSASPSLLDTLALAATAASSEKEEGVMPAPAAGQMGGGGAAAAAVPAEITAAVSRVDQAIEYVMSVSRVRALGASRSSSRHSTSSATFTPSHPGAGAAAEGSEAETILLLAASGVQFPTRPLNHTTEWRVPHSSLAHYHPALRTILTELRAGGSTRKG